MTAAVSLGCFSPKKICSILAVISFSFFALHCASEALINFGGVSERFYQDFFDSINLDEEFNLTAIYSGLLLCMSSFLLVLAKNIIHSLMLDALLLHCVSHSGKPSSTVALQFPLREKGA